jgi:hypothetical protein
MTPPSDPLLQMIAMARNFKKCLPQDYDVFFPSQVIKLWRLRDDFAEL